MWEKIEKVNAKKRQAIAGAKNLGLVMVNGTERENQKGTTREIVADVLD